MRVLDAGCGSGWHTEYLRDHAATVTAFDLNEVFVERTQARVGEHATVVQANLAEPLGFAEAETFNLIIASLVMHYVKAWRPVLEEFCRVLKPGGTLVFSTHHPYLDWQLFKTEDYFATDLLEDTWDVGKVSFYCRPLTAMSADLASTGFVIKRLLEPQPLLSLQEADSELLDRLKKTPYRLMIRASKLS